MMMKAAMAIYTSRSRAHTTITGSERGPDRFVATGSGGWNFPTSTIV